MSKDRVTLALRSKAEREQAKRWIDLAPTHSRMTLTKPRRSLPQNDKLHAMLDEIAEAFEWAGKKQSVTTWKRLFACRVKRVEFIPNLDNDGFIQVGDSTSEMTVAELSDVIECVNAWAAERGFTFKKEAA